MSDLTTHVFLVEDDANDVALTMRVLRSCGLDKYVTVLGDGKEVVDRLAGIREGRNEALLPDLIILDMKLPKMSGIEVLQWLRADPRTAQVPVLILTACRRDSQLMDLHHLGILGYLEKPVTSVEFTRFVAGLVPFNPPITVE